ncbi:ABC-type branched-chain amino acid transport-system, permease component [Desulforapulum autotrophicum HRM2]|uniref:ABC-type branched-chain amino acid transport-system, permease component n=1 Tax=Desulforapulum autotrophicum (strain ATCC 43914 / DSM 3382 / VKM B-1955 / HRM2) TaxID=177437 RepID=C0QGB9_DESAH|nr:amino acid ABC transporter permease [Desulforapulum autotrophicum]ACN17698.1 ABC-type branched-chain amino acid transport-system, permease component [Desulforapulum autotrophicum HRM2]
MTALLDKHELDRPEPDVHDGLLVFKPSPALPAPLESVGVIGWLKQNLFSSPLNAMLTLAALALLWKIFPPLISWAILDANFSLSALPQGADPGTIERTGACWTFIFVKFRVLMTGLYPEQLLWRPVMAFVIFAAVCAVTALRLLGVRMIMGMWLFLPLPLYFLINGGMGLTVVDQSLWGGLMLSTGLAAIGIIMSIPLGILLALGRRSEWVVIRSLSIGMIESIRGVPLITILFMASVMLPIFLPREMNINNLLRVQIGIILFSAAYIAEVVRGGLQAIPQGQIEAATSLGLPGWVVTAFVVLPQALRHVVPSLIGRCVALFKDTSLVIIVGLLDFLGMIKASAQDPDWLGYDAEAYVFCALVYWIICFSMSRYGRSIEHRNKW